jgi:uncharacterized spore protein YtfJ
MSNFDQDVKTTVDELLKAISTKNVISDPIEVGDNVVITITKVGLGFGTGKGEGRNDKGPSGTGQGVGGAAGVSPVAIVVFSKSISGPGGVEVKTLVPPSGIGRAIGDVANSIMAGMKQAKEKKEQEKTM